MMRSTLDRRTLLKSGAIAAATLSSGSLAQAQPAPTLLRRSVGLMAINDPMLDSYRAAVRAMKALPASDRRSWRSQAEIHLNFCPHNNWYFLPWHRAYLYAFERICRELSGNPNFALPYWDWTSTRQLPAAFTDPTYQGQPNPLFNPTRTFPANFSLPDNMVGPVVIAQLLNEPSFEVFGSSRPTGQNNTSPTWQRRNGITGPLEGNPHNRVHGAIGGDMSSFMSPLDPIFWLHHCNVDRLWQEWIDLNHTEPPDSIWTTYPFNNNFWQPNGTSPYDVAVQGLRNIAALGYRYKDPAISSGALVLSLARLNLNRPRAVSFASLASAASLNLNQAATLNVVLNAPINLNADQTQMIARVQPLDVATAEPAPRVVAIIGDIDPPHSGSVDVRVFVNCNYLSPETPTTDPSYAGTFSFFGADHAGHAAHGGKPSFLVDLTNAVTNLKRTQRPVASEINVQLMPVAIPGAKEASPFRPGSVRVAIV